MPSVETIYQETVMPLPVVDQMRPAEMIVKRAAKARQYRDRGSILKLLKSIHAKKLGRSAAEIDESIRTERDSWDD